VYGVPVNHESKREDFLFFISQSVSRANTVNMNDPSLTQTGSEIYTASYPMGTRRYKNLIRKTEEKRLGPVEFQSL
jgi:hypothetical protein